MLQQTVIHYTHKLYDISGDMTEKNFIAEYL